MTENRKKILLISPYAKGLDDPFAYPPLGLLYMAANMNTKFIPEIHIMDSELFDKFGYDVYGISVHSVAVVNSVNSLISKIHAASPKALIFVGGSGASLIPSTPYIVRLTGEGEKYFDINTDDLDNIKFPARYLLDKDFIVHKGMVHHTNEPSTTMICTRGCPYSCSFCDRVTHGKKFRKRSIENISQEIKYIQTMYGVNWIRFVDDCLTLDKKWFAELCMEFKSLGIKWTCLSRSDCIDPKLLKLMKESGCQEIFFGFESGSQYLLNQMKKRTTVAKNSLAIEMCKDAGITSCAYMLFGFPGEDEDTVDETIHFLDTTKPDKSRISQFVPIPDSDVWNNPDKYQVSIKENWDEYWYYDREDFPLRYHYISTYKMKKLRSKMKRYYEEKGYTHNWVREASKC